VLSAYLQTDTHGAAGKGSYNDRWAAQAVPPRYAPAVIISPRCRVTSLLSLLLSPVFSVSSLSLSALSLPVFSFVLALSLSSLLSFFLLFVLCLSCCLVVSLLSNLSFLSPLAPQRIGWGWICWTWTMATVPSIPPTLPASLPFFPLSSRAFTWCDAPHCLIISSPHLLISSSHHHHQHRYLLISSSHHRIIS